MDILSNIWSAFAVGFACIWVAIGQWFLTMKAMKTIGRNPKMHIFYLTIAILWIALVESAAIYGLIMWFQILTSPDIHVLTAIWIWFAVWLTWLWVWIWEGKMIEWAFNAFNKDPENKNKIMTYMILFLALIESAAIYGLVIWYQLLSWDDISSVSWLAAWLAIGISWLWVGIWEWLLAKKCLETIGYDRNNSGFYLTLWVLGIALVESVVIYWLIIAFNIISINSDNLWIIAASLAVWISAIWVAIGEWYAISGCFDAIRKNPKYKTKILSYMILFIALVESAAIYWLIIAFSVLSNPWDINIAMIWAGLAIWLAWLWVGIWEWKVARNTLINISEDIKSSNFFLTVAILWIALVESAAIYGLIMSMNILNIASPEAVSIIWAGLAIWLAWLWVGIWEWFLVAWATNAMKQNPKIRTKILTYMILFLALVESAAIYGLIVSFQIIWEIHLNLYVSIAIGLAIGLAWLWVWVGEWILWAKALESISKNPKDQKFYLVSTILFIALVESVAIYALVLSFELFQAQNMGYGALWIAAAIWFAGLWVGYAQWLLSSKSMEMMWENPDSKNSLLSLTILGIALVESVAIYGLIISFQILDDINIAWFQAIAMWLVIWLTALWVAYGEWKLLQWAIWSVAHHPEHKNKIISFMVLFLALIESAAIYWLVVWFQLMWADQVWYGLIWVALWVGFAWLWVGIWEGLLAFKSIQYIANDMKNSSFYLVVSVLTIALVESAAIYGLIISIELIHSAQLSDLSMIAAGLAIGLTWLWVWIWEWYMVRWALDAMRLNQKYRKKILVYTILFVALVESVAIYWLVISTQILSQWELSWILALSAALAIGLGGIWVAIWEWIFLHNSLDVIGKNPKFQSLFLTTSILWVALVESAAIYSLVIAFEIMWFSAENVLLTLGAGLSVWLAALWAWIWEWMLAWGTISSMYRNPHEKSRDLAFMVLFIALIEVLAIYGLIISFQILS